jgi:ornithine cyclodeaminase/alanine dehydrogenase-like protein (mu-crystallin family)
MPCIIQDFERKLIKAVKVIGSNIEQRKVKDKISVGKALLLHPQDNFVQAVFDVGSLSSFRTAAISVLAYKYLSGKGSRRTGIIGAGRVGFYTALILHKWLGMRKIYLSDANAKQLSNFLKGTALSLPKLKVTAGTLSELSRGSDALFLTTNTRMPILSDENAGSVKFISSIGADSNTQSELEASILKGRRTFTDSKSGLRFGDLKHWLGKGLIHEGEITELRDVNGAQTTIKTKSLFVSTGIAVHDALACQFLFDHLRRR